MTCSTSGSKFSLPHANSLLSDERTDDLLVSTPRGPVRFVRANYVEAHRVGFPPTTWEWTPWEYATNGRFTGRWDDPDGIWRTLYVGATRLACYLEVLAFARPSLELSAALDDIIEDDDDHHLYPTIAVGRLHRSWMTNRIAGRATITGWFVEPGDTETLATLRKLFRANAIRHGLADLDTAAIRDGRPRELTQAISQWISSLLDPAGASVAGIQFDSRHGDRQLLWAVYERPSDGPISHHVDTIDHEQIDATDEDLISAMRLLDIDWEAS